MRLGLTGIVVAALIALAAGAPSEATGPTAKEWVPDTSSARHYAKQRQGRVSFEIIDLAGRPSGFGPRQTYPMASTIKVMLLVAYLDRQSVRHRRLHSSEKGLLGPMIRRSSNQAATRVLGIVGSGGLHRVARRARMHRFHFDPAVWGLSRTDPLDQARFMLRIEGLLPPRHRAYALHLLAHVIPSQRWGIGRVHLPDGWNLYFKGGWGSGTGAVDHQVALIESGSERLALAIYTQSDPSHEYGKQTLRGVASRLLAGLPQP
jgi:hypothetical protein